MDTCPHCGWTYPEGYLSPVFGTDPTPPICGICALAHMNTSLGLARTRFDGHGAEQTRLRALRWRERYPERAPKETPDAP